LVSGTGPWTWTCAGSNGGTNAPCSTLAIGSCSLVNKTSTPGFSCKSGEKLNGTNCEFDSSSSCASGEVLSGGNCVATIFATVFYQTNCYSGGSPKCIIEKIFKDKYNGNDLFGTYQSGGFGNNVTMSAAFNLAGGAKFCPAGWSPQNNPYGGDCSTFAYKTSPKPTFSCGAYPSPLTEIVSDRQTCTKTSTNSNTCPTGTTLSTDKKTCSYPAQKIYSCTNVCSAQFNNLKGDFDSIDEKCDPTNIIPGSARNPVVDCDCGISTTKVNAPGVDYSSCASNLCKQSSAFNLTIKVDNTKVEDLVDGISVSTNGSPISVPAGTEVNLTATAFSGSKLGAWLGDACAGNTTPTCSFTMDKDLTAIISSNPITCSDTCATTNCGAVCIKTDCSESLGTENCNKLKVNKWQEVSP
jgi:hypothetical protein